MDKNVLGQGTGFFIDNQGHLITNYHVLENAYHAEVKAYNGKTYSIESIIGESKTLDLIEVLVNIPEKPVQWLKVVKILPNVAERILVVGSPMGLEQTLSEGIISAVREKANIGKILQISAPVSPGSSGSPVVNMQGEVIGVATFQFVKGQNLNFAVPGIYVLGLKQEKPCKKFSEWNQYIREQKALLVYELWLRGYSFCEAGKHEKALSLLEEAREKDPSFGPTWVTLGQCYFNLGKYEATIEACKEAIRIEPDDGYAHFLLAFAYDKLGRSSDAIEAWKQVIKIDPNNATAHINLAYNYDKLGRFTEAIKACKQAIRIEPDDHYAHFLLAKAYGELGHFTDAIEALKQVIRIDPDYVGAHYMLGFTYVLIGNKGAALEEYKILKNLDKDRANELFNIIYE